LPLFTLSQASLNRLLQSEIGEALADPFIAVRTGLQIWQKAGEELEVSFRPKYRRIGIRVSLGFHYTIR